MKKELDERFKIVNTKDRKEYLEKIDLFLNQYEKLKPECKDSSLLSVLFGYNRKLFKKYELVILDSEYFSKGKLNTSYYNFYIAYSNVLKKKIILANSRGYYNNTLFLIDLNDYRVTLSMLRRLYKVLVENVVDHACLLREFKENKDEAFRICNFKYHYSPTENKGMKFETINYDASTNRFRITYSPFTIKNNIQFSYSNINYGYNYVNPNMLVKTYEGCVHSNDFQNEIKPLILKTIENNIAQMTNTNEEVLNNI